MSEFFSEIYHIYDDTIYQTLNFDPDTLRLVIIFVWIGAVIAFVGSFYANHYLGGFVQRLIGSGANSPESAKTLAQLGINKLSLLAFSLREGSVLRRTVMSKNVLDSENAPNISQNLTDMETNDNDSGNKAEKAENTRKAKKQKEDIASLAFYIPSERQEYAQNRYRRKGNGVLALTLSIAVITLVCFLLAVFGPWLMQILDELLTNFSKSE